MLDQCFRRPRSAARLRAGPFGKAVEEFAAYLHDRGHAFKVIQGYVRGAHRLTRWLAAKGTALDAIDERLCCSFLRSRRGRMRIGFTRPGVRLFLRMLRARGIVPTPSTEPTSNVGRLVAEYDAYLRDVAGLAPASRVSRTRFAREFLHGVFGDGPIHTERLQPKHVHAFVAGFGRAGCVASVPPAASSLRRFIRWLQLEGRCSAALILAVPSFRTHRHASLPKVMTDQQICSLLDTFDRPTPVGRRVLQSGPCRQTVPTLSSRRGRPE